MTALFLLCLLQNDFHVIDYPDDDGTKVIAVWNVNEIPCQYEVRIFNGQGESIGKVSFSSTNKEYLASAVKLPFWVFDKNSNKYAVALKVPNQGKYKVELTKNNKLVATADGEAVENFFDSKKLNNLIVVLGFLVLIIYFAWIAKRKELFIRKLAGLDALEEAIGRATEMGKPVVYQLGMMEIGEDPLASISLVASFGILGEVAHKVASYETPLLVPHRSPLNMVICQEITKEAYTRAGKPHLYKESSNFFVSPDQFAYVSKMEGIYMREKPATCIYMGYFFAESLVLAETAASVGAIQIAGTDALHQLPFFFAACDYTLIGEELYAAGAYLSREYSLLSSIKIHDYFRILVTAAILVATISISIIAVSDPQAAVNAKMLDVFKPF
ncbi:MAG: hypothetical protein HY606_13985 [Planctomycetes bacterium]|nr:hypothetical protein [Planctomycetota bacterium]